MSALEVILKKEDKLVPYSLTFYNEKQENNKKQNTNNKKNTMTKIQKSKQKMHTQESLESIGYWNL